MANSDDQGAQVRQALLSRLLDSVKQCQIRFGGRTELATENDSRVICLCAQFENVLQHGIRKNTKGLQKLWQVTEVIKGLNLLNGDTEHSFWHFTRTVLNKHEYERYMLLKNIHTDIGRGRAWLRSALNERSLERYIHLMLSEPNQICQFYEDWAFMMDQERSSMLPMMAAGLGSILFAINIDNADLNSCRSSFAPEPTVDSNKNEYKNESFEPQPVISKSIGTGKRKKKRRTPTTQVVSFDDNEMSDNYQRSQDTHPECYSAPATCFSSPVTTIGNFVFHNTQVQTVIATSDAVPIVTTTQETAGVMICTGAVSSSVQIPSVGISSSEMLLNPGNSSPSQMSNSDGSFSQSVNNNLNKSSPTAERNDQRVKTGGSVQKECSDSISNSSSRSIPVRATLTPIDDSTVGELIPVNENEDIPSSAEDSASIPSFCEDVDNAVAALAIVQRVHSWSVSSNNSQSSRKDSQSRSRTETLSMSVDELREAVLAILQKKEEAEDKNKALRSLLDREMEMNAGLRAEMDEKQSQHDAKIERLESKIQTIARENELLKHQLRKYINAVQQLKHDSSRVSELSLVGDIQPAIPEPKPYIDHQHEASEYEKKLVQVAEMHGELMEFNDRLHRLILQRESVIRRLREELIDLRGPLPDDNQTSDDEVSITSDYDASSQTTPHRPLINIWIPSAFLTGHATDTHHVYQVYVRIRDDEWNVYRRYAQFYALHKMLKKRDPILNTFDFPPKKTIGKKDAKVVELRRRRLQHYLRCVLNWLLQNNAELSNAPDRETFVSLMPFFGDSKTLGKTNSGTPVGNRRGLPGSSSSPTTQQRQPFQQHYTGL